LDFEKRHHPRFFPQGLHANIAIKPALSHEEVALNGEIVDMSYSGIKIRLQKPLQIDLDNAEVRISLILPQSNLPVSINGMIKHIVDNKDFGLQFSSSHTEQSVDNLMFECIKLSRHPAQL
jgi:PilZ domain-containing protein